MKITVEINGKAHEIELSDEAVNALQMIARRSRISFPAAVQQAILNEAFLEELTDNGGQLLVKQDRQLKELNFA